MSIQILCGIYRIRNTVNGKVYVGSAVNVADRWRLHRRQLKKGIHHCPPLQRAWVKHGEIAFVFELIEAVERKKEALDSREQAHLNDAFATGLAYNICRIPGSALGVKRSAEHCARTSASNRGRKFSAGHRANLAAAKLGSKQSTETVAKRLAKTRGRKRSPEQSARMSAAQLGNTKWLGRKHTAQTLARMSSRWIEFNGHRASLTDWAKSLGTSIQTLRYRLAQWPLSRALTEPPQSGRKHSAESIDKMVVAWRARRIRAAP